MSAILTPTTNRSATKLPNLPLLVPRLLLGLRTDIVGNVHYLSDNEIVYPVGSVISVHNFHQRRQKFIKLANRGRNVNIITISPNKKLLAVAEEGGRPFINLWCLQTFKRKHVLTLPGEKDINATKFAAIAFSADSKYLYTVTGESDWHLYVYKADRGRLVSTTRANNMNGTGQVRQIATNPTDINSLAFIGKNLLKIMACIDFTWRQYGFNKTDNWDFTSAVWVSQERLLCGDSNGRILYLENGDLRTIFNANDLSTINLNIRDELQQTSQTSLKGTELNESLLSAQDSADQSIRSMIIFPRGLAFGYLTGHVHFYEMETPVKYTKRNVFKIPDHTVQHDDDGYRGDHEKTQTTSPMNTINCLNVNPSQNRLIVTCNESQIYYTHLWMQDFNAVGEIEFIEYGVRLHHGAIASIAVCSWKPILLTAGIYDRKLKIWNYEDSLLEMEQKFVDDLYSVALHPTGLYCLVGFTDKLRFLTITIDKFIQSKEFPIRFCRYCCFSNLGGLFAAANGNMIQIYSSISFEMMYILKGHAGLITGMSWSHDDTKMSSSGHDGAIYQWIITKQERLHETIVKHVHFEDVVITSDGHSSFTVSNNGHLKEIINSNVTRDLLINDNGLLTITLSHIDQMMFIGGPNGIIYNIKLPLMEKAEYEEYCMFASDVTHMKISFDDRYLLTASKSGELCFFKLLNTEEKSIKIDKDFKISKDILIAKHILEERLEQIKMLQLRLKELEIEYSYQIRQIETINDVKIADIHKKYKQSISELNEKIEYIENEHVKEIHNINMEIEAMKVKHNDFVRDLENNYNEKLIFEYEKYQRLEIKLQRIVNDYEEQLKTLQDDKTESEQQITDNFIEQLQRKEEEIAELLETLNKQTDIHETIKRQIEDDVDREIVDLKKIHANHLLNEQNLNIRLQGEQTIIKKKLITSQKQIDDLKLMITKLQSEQEKLRKTIIDLERDCNDLKNEINERDQTIQTKEKRIVELKLKNQEFEKYQFILNCKIDELKTQLQPKDEEIQQQQEQINDMIKGLENLQKAIVTLDVQNKHLQDKLKVVDSERYKDTNRIEIMKRELKKIKAKIYEANCNVQNIPVLVKMITEMADELKTDFDFDKIQFEDKQIRNEFQRQRDFLEHTIATLRRQLRREVNQPVSVKNERRRSQRLLKTLKERSGSDIRGVSSSGVGSSDAVRTLHQQSSQQIQDTDDPSD